MAKKTFESALKRLEQITHDLEEGELSLDVSLKKFDEGIELVNFCNTQLEEARSRVKLLVLGNDSSTSVDFNEDFNEEQNGN